MEETERHGIISDKQNEEEASKKVDLMTWEPVKRDRRKGYEGIAAFYASSSGVQRMIVAENIEALRIALAETSTIDFDESKFHNVRITGNRHVAKLDL